MLLGPVFRAELLRTARRRRYYVMRLLYGMMLLAFLWAGYQESFEGRSTITIDEAAEFAEESFLVFGLVQYVVILLLIPALFGGSIADEKQRKTLHYLMASQLSSFEIVVDKVLGRAPHVGVFLAMGLPIICLLGLVGGVPPEHVAIAYLGTFSTASMAVAMTVLISTLARKVRQSVLIAYILLLAWQFVPTLLYAMSRSGIFPEASSWIDPVNAWVGATSPLYFFTFVVMRAGGLMTISWSVVEPFLWMVGLQLGLSALFVLLAVWQLRPTFRRHEATQPRRKWFEGKKGRKARAPRWYDRPPCGGDAMAWKERYFARTDILTKMVVLPATVLVSVFLVMFVGLDESVVRAFSDLWLWTQGQRAWGVNPVLVENLRVVTAWYVAIWLLAVAGASASSVAVEREEDTWVSLTSTPLTGWEILRGKVLGALWAQRGFALIPLGLWAIGLLTASVHPLGILLTLVAFAVVTWMVAAVGVHASLRATSTSRALTATIAKLVVLYGYPFFLFWTFLSPDRWESAYTPFVGMPPRIVIGPLVSYAYFAGTTGVMEAPSVIEARRTAVYFGVVVLAGYATLAAALTYLCALRFDRWLDRPELTGEGRIKPEPRPVAEVEAEPALQS